MKILVFGSDGFIGRNVCTELGKKHEVIKAVGHGQPVGSTYIVDLADPQDVCAVIAKTKPQIIINCAGIVGGGMDFNLNIIFSKNIIEQAAVVGGVEKIIISGSAGEYGKIETKDLPVDENVELRADAGYGYSKIQEEKTALSLGEKYNINIIVLRIFNPIGLNMANRFLLTNIMAQVDEIKSGSRKAIEVSRLDSKRDYIAVTDIATAFEAVVDNNVKHHIYNVGSGKSTSNGELIDAVIKNSGVDTDGMEIKETSENPESLVANRADITRISTELGWLPRVQVSDLIKEIYS